MYRGHPCTVAGNLTPQHSGLVYMYCNTHGYGMGSLYNNVNNLTVGINVTTSHIVFGYNTSQESTRLLNYHFEYNKNPPAFVHTHLLTVIQDLTPSLQYDTSKNILSGLIRRENGKLLSINTDTSNNTTVLVPFKGAISYLPQSYLFSNYYTPDPFWTPDTIETETGFRITFIRYYQAQTLLLALVTLVNYILYQDSNKYYWD